MLMRAMNADSRRTRHPELRVCFRGRVQTPQQARAARRKAQRRKEFREGIETYRVQAHKYLL
jgi:hypothetical protein